MSMTVQFHGTSDRSNVQHVAVKSNGDVVLRFSGHKETVKSDEHAGFNVVDGR